LYERIALHLLRRSTGTHDIAMPAAKGKAAQVCKSAPSPSSVSGS